jgi:alpha/beta superfamily hydrolase
MKDTAQKIEMTIDDLEIGSINLHEGYYPISLKTSRGILECRYYASHERRRGVVFAGSEHGGWDTPVRDMLYPGLSNDLARNGINCIRIKYRFPGNFGECILDVLAGVSFLTFDGVESVGLVGHSFGGAAVIQAAAASPYISTVVSLSPQSFGTDAVDAFREKQSILLIHGTGDKKLSADGSSNIYEYAHEPKKIILYKGATHNLDEAAPEIFKTVKQWLQMKV